MTRKFIQLLFLLFWSVALCTLPVAKLSAMLFGKPTFQPFPSFENREPEPLPDFKKTPVREWGRGMEAWYNDHHAYRTELLLKYRLFLFDILKTPVGREVPGVDGWIFRRGDADWPELDDYLGAFELSPREIQDWLELFDGRSEWCSAHGAFWLLVPTPVKAQVRIDKIPLYIRAHRGPSVARQIQNAIATTDIQNNILFIHDRLRTALDDGKEVYFKVDHHLNAFGTFLLYDEINARLRTSFPGHIGELPFFDHPSQEVLANTAFGCYRQPNAAPEDEGGRLCVSAPGEHQLPPENLLSPGSRRYPYCNILTERPATNGLSILMSHDSYMRFTLSSWREKPGSVRFPFAPGIARTEAYIFHRITTPYLEQAFSRAIPDIVIEQFPEVRLNRNPVGLDETMRTAARFARAAEYTPGHSGSGPLLARAILDNVSTSAPDACAELRQDNAVVASAPLRPGPRRAVYFPAVPLSQTSTYTLSLKNCTATDSNLTLRIALPAPPPLPPKVNEPLHTQIP